MSPRSIAPLGLFGTRGVETKIMLGAVNGRINRQVRARSSTTGLHCT